MSYIVDISLPEISCVFQMFTLSLPAAPLTFPPHNKRAPLNALYGVKVGVLESCHLIGSEDFAIPQSLKETDRRFVPDQIPHSV